MRTAALLLTGLALAPPVTAMSAETGAALTGAAAPAMLFHELGQSYMYLRVHDDSLVVRLEITIEDLGRALGTGWTTDNFDQVRLESEEDRIRAYVEPRFDLSAGGEPLPLRYVGAEVHYLEIADYVTLTYATDGTGQTPHLIDVEYAVLFEVNENHRNLLVIEHHWGTATFNNEANVSLIFSPRSSRQTLDLTSSSVLRGFIGFIWLGVWHIFIGLDHILFLMALALPSVLARRDGHWEPVASWRKGLIQIVTIVTFFTIAHSITLSLAALDVVRLPSRLVESVIAGSIAVAAAANLMPRLEVREWAIAFVFGLFHGFGFASVLGDIGMGQEYLVLSLLGFNVGVEVGQVTLIAGAFVALFMIRRSVAYPLVLRTGSVVMIVIASYWLVERALAVDIPLGRALRPVVASLLGA